MEFKLTRTMLSKKPEGLSILAGVIGLAVLSLFFGADERMFWASKSLVFSKHEYWRAFTATLLHADLNHLAHNAFFFTGLSALLFNYFGFWVFPVVSFIAGGFINMVTIYFYPPDVHLVGVSGVVYFMASFWLTMFILIERRQKLRIRFMHAVAVSLIFLFPETYEGHVSYLCHAVGFVFGVTAGLLYYVLFKKEIHAKDVWTEVVKEKNDTILLDPMSYHLVQPEEHELAPRASDCAQCPQH